jgi:1,4-dihydroxy-2-naphthoate octaprenyltransferase
MNELLKMLGAIVVLIGVLFLLVYYFAIQSNTLLALGGISMFLGFIAHILLNKFLKDKE